MKSKRKHKTRQNYMSMAQNNNFKKRAMIKAGILAASAAMAWAGENQENSQDDQQLANIHTDEEIFNLFGDDFNLKTLGDSLKMKMVPILKLDSSIKPNDDYEENDIISNLALKLIDGTKNSDESLFDESLFQELQDELLSQQYDEEHRAVKKRSDTGQFSPEMLKQFFANNFVENNEDTSSGLPQEFQPLQFNADGSINPEKIENEIRAENISPANTFNSIENFINEIQSAESIESVEDDDGRKFWLVNGKSVYYDRLPQFNHGLDDLDPENLISELKHLENDLLQDLLNEENENSFDKPKIDSDISEEQLQLMTEDQMKDFSTLHFPTCYNDLENKTANCNKPVIIVFAIILALICIASISGNFLVLLVIAKSSRLRKPPSVFKVSLAIADLLLSLFVIPSLLYNLFSSILVPDDPIYTITDITDLQKIPNWIPRTVGSAQLISMTASILTLLVMSVDRLVAIRWPIYHRIHNSINRASCSILVIWVISLIPTIIMNISRNIKWHLEPHTMTYGPTFYSTENLESLDEGIYNPLPLQSRVFGISYCVIYWVFPWILTTFLTIGVGFYGWKSLKSLKTIPKQRVKPRISDTTDNSGARIIVPIHDETSNESNATTVTTGSDRELLPVGSIKKNGPRQIIRRTENKNEDSSKRLVKTLTILVIMYTICTLPLTILQLYMWINDSKKSIRGDSFRWLWFIASFLYLGQSAMNIFIYHRSKEFSEALKNLYGRKRTSIYNQTGSYRNTLRTNIQSHNRDKARVFKQHTMTTSDGGNQITKISAIADSPGIGNINSFYHGHNHVRSANPYNELSEVSCQPSVSPSPNAAITPNAQLRSKAPNSPAISGKGHLISRLDTKTTSQRNAERLAVFNMDLENDEIFSPPRRVEDVNEIENFEPMTFTNIVSANENYEDKILPPSLGLAQRAQEPENDNISVASGNSGSGHGSGMNHVQ